MSSLPDTSTGYWHSVNVLRVVVNSPITRLHNVGRCNGFFCAVIFIAFWHNNLDFSGEIPGQCGVKGQGDKQFERRTEVTAGTFLSIVISCFLSSFLTCFLPLLTHSLSFFLAILSNLAPRLFVSKLDTSEVIYSRPHSLLLLDNPAMIQRQRLFLIFYLGAAGCHVWLWWGLVVVHSWDTL